MQFTKEYIDKQVMAYILEKDSDKAVANFNEAINSGCREDPNFTPLSDLDALVVQAIWDESIDCETVTVQAIESRLPELDALEVYDSLRDLEARLIVTLQPEGVRLL